MAPPLSGPRTAINLTASGDNTVIAGATGKVITIYELVLWSAAANTIILKDGSTSINGDNGFNFPAQTGFVYDGTPNSTTLILGSGNAFVINLSASSNVNGWVYYTQSTSTGV